MPCSMYLIFINLLLIFHLGYSDDIYHKTEACFKLPVGPKRIEYEKIPTQVIIDITCDVEFENGKKIIKHPAITSVVYSTPIVWSEFCADMQYCCTKTFEKGRCLHEVDSGWELECPENLPTCKMIVPRLDMKGFCDFQFPCKDASCWNRWVDVTYQCVEAGSIKTVPNKAVVQKNASSKSQDKSYERSYSRGSHFPFWVVMLLFIGIGMYIYTHRNRFNGSFYPKTPRIAATFLILILVPLYILYSSWPVVN